MTILWFNTLKFSKHHSVRALKSFRNSYFIMSPSFPILYKLLWSALILKQVSVKNNTASLINKLNKRGPSMKSSGTPARTFFAEIKLLFYCTDGLWFQSNCTSDLMGLLKTHTLLTLLVINRDS